MYHQFGYSRVLDPASLTCLLCVPTPPFWPTFMSYQNPYSSQPTGASLGFTLFSYWNIFSVISQFLPEPDQKMGPGLSLQGWAISPLICSTPTYPSKLVHIFSLPKSHPWSPHLKLVQMMHQLALFCSDSNEWFGVGVEICIRKWMECSN